MVIQWFPSSGDDLFDNWRRAQMGKTLFKIAPLE